MEMTERRVFTIEDPSQAGDVRRSASALAAGLGADVADAGRVALLVTEAATNVVKHGRGGELLLYGGRDGEAWSVGVLAVDRGPGMPDVTSCLEDGMSTFGSAGEGLGAIRRLSTTFDLHTSPAGTVVFAEVRAEGRARGARPGPFVVGGVRVPHPGEETCGDDWAVVPIGDARCVVLVVDGLGHGLGASAAAEEATRLFRAQPSNSDGLFDAFRLFEQRPSEYTWWDYGVRGFPKNRGLRIDHMLVSDALACVAGNAASTARRAGASGHRITRRSSRALSGDPAAQRPIGFSRGAAPAATFTDLT